VLAFHLDGCDWKAFVVVATNVRMAALSAEGTSALQTFSKSVNLERVQDEERCQRFVNTELKPGSDKNRGISLLTSDH
jgi:hypothetical protein